MYELTINDKRVVAEPQWSVLEAARSAGIAIPSLCESGGEAAFGVCRLCMVEIEGMPRLQSACATAVSEGLVVKTNTDRVRRMQRTAGELLLREHEPSCHKCRSGHECEVAEITARLGVQSVTGRSNGSGNGNGNGNGNGSENGNGGCEHLPLTAIFRNPAKCIECRRCLQECSRIHGTGTIAGLGLGEPFGGTGAGQHISIVDIIKERGLMQLNCVQCGHCAPVCPVGAVGERTHVDDVWRALADGNKHVVVQTAPAIRASLGECFGNDPGTLVTGKMNTALRHLGFDAVFETNVAADITILEEATELLVLLADHARGNGRQTLPLLTSCCPGWINYAESAYPDLLSHVSTCKSPQQMMGALTKSYYAERKSVDPANLVTVAVMPCTAKKQEASRAEHTIDGMREVDYVLTTRDLASMIRTSGVTFNELNDSSPDTPFGTATGAGDIFANSGGVTIAALRTAFHEITGRSLPYDSTQPTEVEGFPGVRSVSVPLQRVKPAWSFLEGTILSAAIAQGLGNAQKLLDTVRAGKADYSLIEIMTCPGGCIGGGGQPRPSDRTIRAARRDAVSAVDRGKTIRASYDNPYVKQLYDEYLGVPNGAKAHRLLHVHRRAAHSIYTQPAYSRAEMYTSFQH